MRFFIVDDDESIRTMLTEIIEDFDIGKVVGEAENGSLIDNYLLSSKKVDILIIDFLMPIKDGLQTVRDISPDFQGKIIMLSQVEDKEIIGKAYSCGIEYYITKPINRIEVMGVINKVLERMKLEKSIQDIQKTLSFLDLGGQKDKNEQKSSKNTLASEGQYLLTELGIIGENGSKDLLGILQYLSQYERESLRENNFPSLKDIFSKLAESRLGETAKPEEIKKEIKATEQRIRRAIFQGLNYIASLGLTDYSNHIFEDYAAKFYEFPEVRKRMLEIKKNVETSKSSCSINIKRFVKVLYMESKKNV